MSSGGVGAGVSGGGSSGSSSNRSSGSGGTSPSVDDLEWKSVEIEGGAKTWKDNIFVPLGILGGAIALGGALVMRGKGDGRGLSQRVMEARVGVQAAVLLGLVTFGYALSNSKGTNKRPED